MQTSTPAVDKANDVHERHQQLHGAEQERNEQE